MSEHEQISTSSKHSTQELAVQRAGAEFAIALRKEGDINTLFLYDKSRFNSEDPMFDPTELEKSEYIAKISFNKITGQTMEMEIGLLDGFVGKEYEPKEIQKIVNYVRIDDGFFVSQDEGRIAYAAYISSVVSNPEQYLGEEAPIKFCPQHIVYDFDGKDESRINANKSMGKAIEVLTDKLRVARQEAIKERKDTTPRFVCMPYSAYTKIGRHVGAIICDLDAKLNESMMYFDSGDTFREQGLATE